jgi:enediyne biosynthesis protein E3
VEELGMLKDNQPASLEWRGEATRPGRRSPLRRLARALFAISPRETSFAVRGFRWDSEEIRERLEGIAATFVRGYHAALETDPPALAERLDREEPYARGWAYEGAAMALTLLDVLTGRRQGRLHSLLAGAGSAHDYIAHVGAGWVLGRLPLSPSRLLARLDPVNGWLALDGYGFHEGFFHARTAIARRQIPRKVTGYARRAFDQGLGRSLWFVEGTGAGRIAGVIGAFPAARQPDLWSGVGLACGYAGGVDRAEIEALRRAAGSSAAALAQGVAFAVGARDQAGPIPGHTELACQVLCGRSAAEVAALTQETRRGLPPDAGEVPAFEVWRRRIQSHFSKGDAV